MSFASLAVEGSDFTLQNLPWGSMVLANGQQHLCIAIRDHVLDVDCWAKNLKETEWDSEVVSALQQVEFPLLRAG
jgi:hypothetical protein